jgi:hypothetical protein
MGMLKGFLLFYSHIHIEFDELSNLAKLAVQISIL